MFEFIFLTFLIYFLIRSMTRKRKPRSLDAELKELIQESNDVTSIGFDIKRFLLNTINDDKNDLEKFSDAQIAEAQRILDRAGPGAFYWMTEIAAQLAFLGAAQANGLPTNVGEKLGSSATPESIVNMVVQP